MVLQTSSTGGNVFANDTIWCKKGELAGKDNFNNESQKNNLDDKFKCLADFTQDAASQKILNCTRSMWSPDAQGNKTKEPLLNIKAKWLAPDEPKTIHRNQKKSIKSDKKHKRRQALKRALCCAGWIFLCPLFACVFCLRESPDFDDREDLNEDDCLPCWS